MEYELNSVGIVAKDGTLTPSMKNVFVIAGEDEELVVNIKKPTTGIIFADQPLNLKAKVKVCKTPETEDEAAAETEPRYKVGQKFLKMKIGILS